MVMTIQPLQATPHLDAAVQLIALDNGAINRFSSAEEVLDKVRGALYANFPPDAILRVDAELSLFTQDDLQDVCCGGEEYHARLSREANGMLDEIFETL